MYFRYNRKPEIFENNFEINKDFIRYNFYLKHFFEKNAVTMDWRILGWTLCMYSIHKFTIANIFYGSFLRICFQSLTNWRGSSFSPVLCWWIATSIKKVTCNNRQRSWVIWCTKLARLHRYADWLFNLMIFQFDLHQLVIWRCYVLCARFPQYLERFFKVAGHVREFSFSVWFTYLCLHFSRQKLIQSVQKLNGTQSNSPLLMLRPIVSAKRDNHRGRHLRIFYHV